MRISFIQKPYVIPSDWRVRPSQTTNHILLFLNEGTVDYHFTDERRLFVKHELVFIPQGTHREAFCMPPLCHRMTSIHFQAAPDELLPSLLAGVHQLQPSHYAYLSQRFATIAAVWHDQPPWYAQQSEAILRELLALTFRELEQQQHPADKLAMVRAMQGYIEQHYTQRITLRQVAAVVDRTPNHACALFKQIIGCGPIEYANRIRLNQAHEWLHQRDLTVSEVAHRCGFSDPYYFSKLYKRTYGASPKSTISE